MPKMLSPSFPPRRPSGYVRYGMAITLVILLFFVYTNNEPVTGPSGAPYTRPGPGSNSAGASPYGSDTQSDNLAHPFKGTTGSSTEKGGGDKVASGQAPLREGDEADATGPKPKTAGSSSSSAPKGNHPIDKLIHDAQNTFADLISNESKSLEQAAAAYRKRRGRHPPPGFDKWYEFARGNNAVIVEEFFDQIYHDLQPFWGMPAPLLRKEANEFEMRINIRNGVAGTGSDWFWTQIWLNLIKTIEQYLPDMDLALNPMDEPRLVVPWEDIQGYMQKADKTFSLPKAKKVISEFQRLPEPGKGDPGVKTAEKVWEESRPYWNIARRGCPPNSPARTVEPLVSFAGAPNIDVSNADAHSYKGYVSNYSLSTQLCHQPDLQGMEGILIDPLSVSATKTMFPMFGGSKLAVNNEILLPAPMYWNEEERFTGGDDHGAAWDEKANSVVWRGVATGGKNKPDNWRRFQRHRFVAMNNGTAVSRAESGEARPENFALPDKRYDIAAQKQSKAGEWVKEWADVSFIDLMCDPPTEDGSCPYTDPYFERSLGLKMSVQFGSKYVPDIDGNSFSGRYLGFLRSTSLPIKATIWREWHDSRLVPWKHFVPMDSRFGDYYGIMEYFLGYGDRPGHDAAAERMAFEGKEWAEKVLRKEDMQIYTFRLLLEYARVMDERRERLGWVDDIKKNPSIEKAWTGGWW